MGTAGGGAEEGDGGEKHARKKGFKISDVASATMTEKGGAHNRLFVKEGQPVSLAAKPTVQASDYLMAKEMTGDDGADRAAHEGEK